MDVFQPIWITNSDLPVTVDTNKITDNFTFLYVKKKFIYPVFIHS